MRSSNSSSSACVTPESFVVGGCLKKENMVVWPERQVPRGSRFSHSDIAETLSQDARQPQRASSGLPHPPFNETSCQDENLANVLHFAEATTTDRGLVLNQPPQPIPKSSQARLRIRCVSVSSTVLVAVAIGVNSCRYQGISLTLSASCWTMFSSCAGGVKPGYSKCTRSLRLQTPPRSCQ